MLIKHLLGSQPCAQYMYFIYSVNSNDVDKVPFFLLVFHLQMGNLKLEEVKYVA